MRTSTAQTPTDGRRRRGGLVLLELLIVVAIIGMMTGLATVSLTGVFAKKKFEQEAYAIVDVLKRAYHASMETNRRYAVVFDFVNGRYVLRQFATLDLQTLPEDEAVISVGHFSKYCVLDYVLFDDLMDTRDEGDTIGEAKFRAGHGGWQAGGKIVLLDVEGNPYSILVNRLCGNVRLVPGDAEILVPVDSSDLRF